MKPKRPFYSYPQERLDELLDPIATAIRSLPDNQLQAELDTLIAECAKPGLRLSEGLLQTLYRAEQARRSDPEHRHDDDLDLTLSRLERKTNDVDRAAVIEMGRDLYRTGGMPCLLRARDRLVQRAKADRRDLRASMLAKRWRLEA
jgi:hypothetical protein